MERDEAKARQAEVSTHNSIAYGSIIAKPSCITYLCVHVHAYMYARVCV